jgi:outer membrane protein assembly factor BamB
VQINAICPLCKTSYQLPADMRGKMMRCPNHLCRHVFPVGADQAPPPTVVAPRPESRPAPAPAKPQRSGAVGDLIPMLPSEEVKAPPAAPPTVRPLPVAPILAEVPELLPLVEPEPFASDVPEVLEVVEPEVVAEEVPEVLEVVEEEDIPKPKKKPPREPAGAPSWQQAPPVVRRAPEPEPAVVSAASDPEVQTLEGPREMEVGAWQTAAPPVRTPEADEQPAPTFETPAAAPHYLGHDPYPVTSAKKTKWGRVFLGMVAFFIIVGGGLIGGYFYVSHQNEEGLFNEAVEEYEQGKYSQAGNHFKQLEDKFPFSERKDEYAYLESLCNLLGHIGDPQVNLEERAKELEKFLDDNINSPHILTYADGLARTAAKVLTESATAVPVGPNTMAQLDGVERVSGKVAQALADAGLTSAEQAQLNAAIAAGRAKYARWQVEQNILAELKLLPGPKPLADAIQEAKRLIRLKKMEDNVEARREVERLYDEHFRSVTFQRVGGNLVRQLPPEEHASILAVTPVKRSTSVEEDGIVLALVQGVLYALRRSDGQVKWYLRVGIDTAALPVRVPAKAPTPESFLVVSADTKTLTAINDNGQALWEYQLGKPSRGRPLIVERDFDRLAYVPTYDGQVHVIELAQGKLVGFYDFKHHLTTGGVLQRMPAPAPDRMYFPADDECVYVINPKEERLERILYTEHPSETLRGEPLIVAPDSAALARGEGFLLLNQTDGLHGMRLRLFPLPLTPTDRKGPEADVNPAPRVPGWTWFPPTYDGEKIVMLSDTGVLGLFGVKQAGTNDPLLYPRLASGGVSLDPYLLEGGRAETKEQGRSQVVQVLGNDFWVLAHGRLQHLAIAWSASEGPRPVAVWRDPVPLGSPQHAAQVFTRNGNNTLFLVTRSLKDPSFLATAVDDETGSILWQRQLGLTCRGAPAPLRLPSGKGDPVLLVLDQGGGLFALDPGVTKFAPGERAVRIADAVEDNPDVPPLLLPTADGQAAYEIACPGKGTLLQLRHVKLEADGTQRVVAAPAPCLALGCGGVRFEEGRQVRVLTDKSVPLNSPMHGTPAIVANLLVVPLADGSVAQIALPLAENPAVSAEEYWRSDQAGPETRGHALALGPDRFLVTDGARGFKVWKQEKKGAKVTWVMTANALAGPGFELENLVGSAPVLLPGGSDVCVADAAGVVWLLTVQPDGSLKPKPPKWDLHAKVTAGPFVRTVDGKVRIGCVVGQRRLVWLDPTAAEPLWTYETAQPIIGEPQLVEGWLIVADQSRRVVGIDPATGTADGLGYTLRGSLAPATSPVSFDADRLFLPLSDATVMLLPLDYFRKPKSGAGVQETPAG